MDKLRVYQVASLLLLIANIGLAFLLFRGPHHRGHSGPRAKNILNLNERQQEYFHESQRQHKRAMEDINRQHREVLHDWFQQLKTEKAPQKPTIPPAIDRLEREKIQKTYAHLIYVKSLLGEDQRARYPEFVDQNLRRILAGPPGRKGGKHGH